MSVRRVLSWTEATVRWWKRLGHIDDCPCKKSPGRVTFRITPGQPLPERWRRVWECWAQAVEKLSQPACPTWWVRSDLGTQTRRPRG